MRITSKVLVMDMLAVYWGLCGGLVRGENKLAMCSLEPPVMLPDGTEFQTWEQSLRFERTYHVDGSNPNASDANPGTSDRPFATINRAAQVLQPGERVIVAAGVYREWIRPERGGSGPDRMISYEAAPGAPVVIKGSRPFKAEGRPTTTETTGVPVWIMGADGSNPHVIEPLHYKTTIDGTRAPFLKKK